jgi:hypothetical protein
VSAPSPTGSPGLVRAPSRVCQSSVREVAFERTGREAWAQAPYWFGERIRPYGSSIDVSVAAAGAGVGMAPTTSVVATSTRDAGR